VHAQSLSVTNLAFPSSATAGSLEPIPVSVTVPYNDTLPNHWLIVGITDQQTTRAVPGVAVGSPDACINQEVAEAVCEVQLFSTSGVENVQFRLGGIFAITQPPPGAWKLQVIAELLDVNKTVLTRSTQMFIVHLAPAMLTVAVPQNVTVWIDGLASTGREIPVALGQHTVAVPMFVTINGTNRLRFDHWSDGVTEPNRTVRVSSETKLAAIYHNQYLLVINSNAVSVAASGAGWYDDGSIASFSVPAVHVSAGVLDFLGAKETLQGWYEDGQLITSSSSGTVDMNQPHTINVQWTVDYTLPALLFTLVAIALGISTYFVTKRSRLEKKPSAQRKSHSKRRVGIRRSSRRR
jgi:hypothetical protein